MLAEAETWVAVSFVLFLCLLAYLGVPKLVTKGLDDRADRIKDEIEEARKLREEAQGLLASYQRKKAEAEKEAEAIVERAKEEAEEIRVQAEANLKEQIERRLKSVGEKITQAEAEAVRDVRNKAAGAAVVAARAVIAEKMTDSSKSDMVDTAISALKDQLH